MKQLRTLPSAAIGMALSFAMMTPAVAQSDDAQQSLMATAVSGSLTIDERPASEEVIELGSVLQVRDAIFEPGTVEADDPRLAGVAGLIANGDVHLVEGAPNVEVEVDTVRVVNDRGAWEGSGTTVSEQGVVGPQSILLHGSGDYDGLTAYITLRLDEAVPPQPIPFDGFVFPGELPPTPELPAE